MINLSKIAVYQFWYDYVKRKYGEKIKLCYMDTDSFIIYKKADDTYKEDVETRFYTSSHELDRTWSKGKNK